jgi:phage/plasmid-associated DNA primase
MNLLKKAKMLNEKENMICEKENMIYEKSGGDLGADGNNTYINGNDSLNHLLKSNYCEKDDLFYNFVNMTPPRGKFIISRKDLDELFNLLPHCINQHGLAEKPGVYIPLYFDFDKKVKIGEPYSHGDREKIVIKMSNILYEKFGIKTSFLVLEKDDYENRGFMKCGFHIHDPTIFIKKEIMINHIIPVLEKDFSPELCYDYILDNVYNNPWLVYGAVKDLNLEPYLLTKFYKDEKLHDISELENFSQFEIFDTQENKINVTRENFELLLPRILSINPSYRKFTEIDGKYLRKNIDIVEKVEKEKRVFESNINEDREKLLISLPVLKKFNGDYDTWRKVMIVCKSLYDDDEGYNIFDEWSEDGDTYDDANNRIIWDRCNITDGNFGIIINLLKKLNLYDQVRNQLYKPKFDNIKLSDILFNSEKECADFVYCLIKEDCYYTPTHGWIIFNKETGLWEEDYKDDFMVSYISDILCPIFNEHINNLYGQVNEKKESIFNTDDKVEKALLKAEKKDLEKTFQQLTKLSTKCGSFSYSTHIMKFLKSNCKKHKTFIKEFENTPELFAFADGTCVNIKTGIRRKIEKGDKILYAVSYNYPERNQSNMDLVKKLLLEIFNKQDRVNDYIKFISLSLNGNNNNELIGFHIGDGRNGKGVTDTMNQQVFDVYYAPISNNILCKTETEYNCGDNSEIKRLEYKRIVIASEPAKESKFKTDTIKKLSGNDSISCKSMGKDKCEFVPKFVINVLLNALCDFSHRDVALDNRVVVFKYDNSFVVDPIETYEKQININLKRDISINKNYRDGLLHLLLDTYKECQGIFKKSEYLIQTTKDYMKVQNPLLSWFENNYEIDNETQGIPSKIFHEIYLKNGGDKTMSLTKFGGFIKEICPCKKDMNVTRYKCVIKQQNIQNNNNIPNM